MTNDTMLRMLQRVEGLQLNMDQFFLVVMGMIVFFMQCGFAFLEAGAVRSKNTTNILIKNFLDCFIAGVAYYVCGYAFAFSSTGNEFIGYWNFASSYLAETDYAFWFFQYVFAATAATIVSGAMAERCRFGAYLIYSFFLSAFIYPVVTHWAWSPDGWLSVGGKYTHGADVITVSYQDFAGSGVVHVVGGTAAMVAAYILGPRIGRFTPESRHIKGHSVPLAALGGFILFFGFLAFNGGSQASISQPDDGKIVAIAVKNTILCGSASAVTALILNRVLGNAKWSLLSTINGGLTGMVAICAGCNVMYPWAAVAIGVVSGPTFLVWSWTMVKLKIDDPLDAVAVHLGGGLWGVISVAIFQKDSSIIFAWGMPAFLSLGWQFCGAFAIIAWTLITCSIMFGLLRAFRRLRVDPEVEKHGMDSWKHGEEAYPEESSNLHQRHEPESEPYVVEPAMCEVKMATGPPYDNPAFEDAPERQDTNWSLSHKTPSVDNRLSDNTRL